MRTVVNCCASLQVSTSKLRRAGQAGHLVQCVARRAGARCGSLQTRTGAACDALHKVPCPSCPAQLQTRTGAACNALHKGALDVLPCAARALPRPLLSPVQGISSMVTGTHRASPGAAITPSTRFPHMQEVETLLLASRVMYKVRCPEHGMPCFKRNRLLLTLMLPLPLPWHDV